jgi:hypothetical protein
MPQTIHNPDQYMSDLRQILAQGRKRLAILVGAGAPAGILVNKSDGRLKAGGVPLIPVISQLTSDVRKSLAPKYGAVLDSISGDIGGTPNIEQILSRVRALADALGKSTVIGDGFTFYFQMRLSCHPQKSWPFQSNQLIGDSFETNFGDNRSACYLERRISVCIKNSKEPFLVRSNC